MKINTTMSVLLQVYLPIQFYNYLWSQTGEVDDVGSYGMLASEFETSQLTISQLFPQEPFWLGEIAT